MVDGVVPIAKYTRKVTRFADDQAISAGESLDVLVLNRALDNVETLDQAEDEMRRLDLVIDYASAYR